MYIYIYRERERERERFLCTSKVVCKLVGAQPYSVVSHTSSWLADWCVYICIVAGSH